MDEHCPPGQASEHEQPYARGRLTETSGDETARRRSAAHYGRATWGERTNAREDGSWLSTGLTRI
jgi:hypothetical protein